MEVRSNKLADIRKHYRNVLSDVFSDHEADVLVFQLLIAFTGNSKVEVLAHPERTISESELLKIHFGIKDLLKNKPIQYVTGKAEFYGLTFNVNSKVLIPRPETEELVEQVLKKYPADKPLEILDVGTGSGCIAISLKHYLPKSKVTAIDVSGFALEVAKENSNLNNTPIDFKKVDFLNPDALADLDSFDVIVSNPPYVRPSEKIHMKENVLAYEPAIALFVEENDALVFYRAIAEFCSTHLLKKGWFFCEINQYLHDEVCDLFNKAGFENVQADRDLFGNYRFISGSVS